MRLRHFASASALLIGLAVLPAAVQARELSCRMSFQLSGWSVFHKTATGSGTVTCSNGQSMHVKLRAKGGGLTVGKSHIDNGTGKFTDVHKIADVLGTYAQGDASAGLGKSGTAQVLTKGTVSLALAGSGEGVDLGVSFGGFTIERVGKIHKK